MTNFLRNEVKQGSREAGFLNDYSTQESSKIDMKLTGNFNVPREITLQGIDLGKFLDSYPSEKLSNGLKQKLAKHLSISVDNLILGAGSNGIMQNLMRIFFKDKGELIVPKFSFAQPEYAVSALGGTVKQIEHNPDFTIDFQKINKVINKNTKAIFLCNPNNPTGIYENPQNFIDLAKSTKLPVIVSEASIEYSQAKSLLDFELPKNLIVLRSFSKVYGLSGLRVGYAFMHKEFIDLYKANTTQFEISALSLLIATKVVDDKSVIANIEKIKEQTSFLRDNLARLGIETTNSSSGCFMSTQTYPDSFFDTLKANNVSVVKVENGESGHYFRVAVQDQPTNIRFIKTMKECWR